VDKRKILTRKNRNQSTAFLLFNCFMWLFGLNSPILMCETQHRKQRRRRRLYLYQWHRCWLTSPTQRSLEVI